MKNKIKICFLVRVHLLYFIKSVSLPNCLKSCSQFRLHFRLCLGSCVENASCLPWDGVQVGLTPISFMILFETPQSQMKLHLILINASPLSGHLLHCHVHAAPLLMVLPHAQCERWNWGIPWKTGNKDSYCSSSAH